MCCLRKIGVFSIVLYVFIARTSFAQSEGDLPFIKNNADDYYTPAEIISGLNLREEKRTEWYRFYERTNDNQPVIGMTDFRWEAEDEVRARMWFAQNSSMFSKGGVEISDVVTKPYPYFNFSVYVPTESQAKNTAVALGEEMEHYSFAWKMDKFVGLLRISMMPGTGIGRALEIAQSGFSATLKAADREDAKFWLTVDAQKQLLRNWNPSSSINVMVGDSKFSHQLGECAVAKEVLQDHMTREFHSLGYVSENKTPYPLSIFISVSGRQNKDGTCTGSVSTKASGAVKNVHAFLPINTPRGTYIASQDGQTGVSPEVFLQTILNILDQSAERFNKLHQQVLAEEES